MARGAVHIDNARLHRQESRAAATLQRSMLPTRRRAIPGVRIAHHYMPGDRQAQVGGDWFDAIQLPGGRVALIVGDVMGHGLQAAAVMGQFRTAVIPWPRSTCRPRSCCAISTTSPTGWAPTTSPPASTPSTTRSTAR